MNRTVFVLQLLAAAAIGTAAFGQAAAPPADASAQPAPAAPAAAAPAAAGAAAPAQAGAPAAPAAPEAPPPPPPTLPTTGDGAAVINVINKICVPITQGGNFEALAKANGFKLDNKSGEYQSVMGKKPYMISMLPPSTTNKGVCHVTVRYAIGGDAPIIDALNIWRFLQTPQLHLERSDKMEFPTVERVTTTWDNYENQLVDGKMIGLVLVQINKPDGSPSINPAYDEAEVQYAVRAPQKGEGVIDPAVLAAQEAAAKAAAAAAATAPTPAPAAAGAPTPEAAPAPAAAPATPAT